jgi:hypothetical protein
VLWGSAVRCWCGVRAVSGVVRCVVVCRGVVLLLSALCCRGRASASVTIPPPPCLCRHASSSSRHPLMAGSWSGGGGGEGRGALSRRENATFNQRPSLAAMMMMMMDGVGVGDDVRSMPRRKRSRRWRRSRRAS